MHILSSLFWWEPAQNDEKGSVQTRHFESSFLKRRDYKLRSELPQVKRYLISIIKKLGTRVAERLKTKDLRKLRNIKKMWNLDGDPA